MLLVLATVLPAGAQTALPPVHANAALPEPPPAADIAQWVAGENRTTMTVTAGGVALRGWSYAGTDPSLPAVLFFNGNGATIAGGDPYYRKIAALGPRVVVFDYRGYGFSSGSADVATFQQDGLAVYDALATDAKRGIVVYGFSLGSSIAGYVAAHRAVTGLILAAPIASAREELPVFAMRSGAPESIARVLVAAPDADAAFDGVGFAAHSTAPLLVLHGTADEAVPIAQGREVLAASASVRKRMVELPNTTTTVRRAPRHRSKRCASS